MKKETVEYFKKSKIWQLENDFYRFARKIFDTKYERTVKGKDGNFQPIERQFAYQKVKPAQSMR